jgi:hypothetical protein
MSYIYATEEKILTSQNFKKTYDFEFDINEHIKPHEIKQIDYSLVNVVILSYNNTIYYYKKGEPCKIITHECKIKQISLTMANLVILNESGELIVYDLYDSYHKSILLRDPSIIAVYSNNCSIDEHIILIGNTIYFLSNGSGLNALEKLPTLDKNYFMVKMFDNDNDYIELIRYQYYIVVYCKTGKIYLLESPRRNKKQKSDVYEQITLDQSIITDTIKDIKYYNNSIYIITYSRKLYQYHNKELYNLGQGTLNYWQMNDLHMNLMYNFELKYNNVFVGIKDNFPKPIQYEKLLYFIDSPIIREWTPLNHKLFPISEKNYIFLLLVFFKVIYIKYKIIVPKFIKFYIFKCGLSI